MLGSNVLHIGDKPAILSESQANPQGRCQTPVYLCGWGGLRSHNKKSSAEALGLDTYTGTGHGVGAERKICGGGAACELICPVKRLGAECPTIMEALNFKARYGPLGSVEDLLRPVELV